MTGLAYSDHSIRVDTGAGDDLLQVTGVPCNYYNYHQNCFWGTLGTGINTLSFQGMNTKRLEFPTGRTGRAPKILVGIKYDMRSTGMVPSSEIYLRLKDSPVTERSQLHEYRIGYVTGVNVFHGMY